MIKHLKKHYIIYLTALLGLIILTGFVTIVICGFYFVAKVFFPEQNATDASIAMLFIFACLAFLIQGPSIQIKS